MNCPHCDEEVLPGDPFQEIMDGSTGKKERYHFECAFRMICGSVGHLHRRCSCYGGFEDDPPDMTLRQAAKAALDLWHELEENRQRNEILIARGYLHV